MDCHNSVAEIVECARAGVEPGPELQGHLRECSRCKERWEDEQHLSAHFRMIRDSATDYQRPLGERERMLREFAGVRRDAPNAAWRWVLSAAAVLLVAIGAGLVWQSRWRPSSLVADVNAYRNSESAALREPAILEDVDDNDFVDVPYAPPLATGEFVQVVRAELRPTALARLGVSVDATEGGEIAAELLVGEDGSPRAVRLVGQEQF